MKSQKGNASVIIIFILIVLFSIYLAGGPGFLLSGESPKPETILSGTPGAITTTPPTASSSASPTITQPTISPSR